MMREEGRWEGTHIHGRVLLTLAMTKALSNFHAWNHTWFFFLLLFSFDSNARAHMLHGMQANHKPNGKTAFHSCLLSVCCYFVSNVRRRCMHEWQANHGPSGTIEAAGTTHTPEGNRASPTHTCSIKDLKDLTAYMHLH